MSNPLAASAPLRTASRYLVPRADRLLYSTRPHDPVSEHDRQAHDALRAHVLAADYPCVMARSAFNTQRFWVAAYGPLGARENAAQLCHDLYEFCGEFPAPVEGAASFIACFERASAHDEATFEAALWHQLQLLHDVDRCFFNWDGAVSAAPNDPEFSFSVGGRAFFLVGMHPGASRVARRTQMPAIVFNLHEQFVELRKVGKFGHIRDRIQARDLQLQGSANPMADDFGVQSEVAQYSGRAVGRDWKCPFVPGIA